MLLVQVFLVLQSHFSPAAPFRFQLSVLQWICFYLWKGFQEYIFWFLWIRNLQSKKLREMVNCLDFFRFPNIASFKTKFSINISVSHHVLAEMHVTLKHQVSLVESRSWSARSASGLRSKSCQSSFSIYFETAPLKFSKKCQNFDYSTFGKIFKTKLFNYSKNIFIFVDRERQELAQVQFSTIGQSIFGWVQPATVYLSKSHSISIYQLKRFPKGTSGFFRGMLILTWTFLV